MPAEIPASPVLVALSPAAPGDPNGDGLVSQAELDSAFQLFSDQPVAFSDQRRGTGRHQRDLRAHQLDRGRLQRRGGEGRASFPIVLSGLFRTDREKPVELADFRNP